ncbi:hypothetical protein CHS0354_015893 [Potamilus streckersoni]|uniref:Uncharacterized protein n=1 Tax=Potamilus streckersoni TaxID=2493646 RepID=A0AAE0SDF1_9BIVA|nr:hypothetical protein CHS0354_015893 [Potamilus streckersoni]
MYTGGSKDGCSYIPEHTICQCGNTMDLNFEMCVHLTDGFYTWPSRKLSKYYIHCLVGRTLPMECEGSSVVFDIQEKQCSLVYDEVSRMYNDTVPLAHSMLVTEPLLDIDAAETQFVQDISVPPKQTTPALVFNSMSVSDRYISIGKPFSQTRYTALTGRDVTQKNLVPNRSILIQTPSSFVVTNAKRSQHKVSLTVQQSSMEVSVQAFNADMTKTQFVPERAIFESTFPATNDQSSIFSEVSNQELEELQMKATSDENMEPKMAPSSHTQNSNERMSSLDQLGFSSLKYSPKSEHSRTTFSKMVLVAQFTYIINMPITISEYIQPIMAQPASKSAPCSTTEKSKQMMFTDEAIKVSSEPCIFPSESMFKLREFITSEMIQSSFIPVTLTTSQALLHGSGTPAMDTYSLLRISETLHSAIRVQHSSSQTVTFEAGGPSDGLVLKSLPGAMPFIYDSQLLPLRMSEIESPVQEITLTSSIASTSKSLIKVNKSNASCVKSLADMISSSVKDTSNFQSTEYNKSSRTDNSTKLILSTNNVKLNPLNLTNTSIIAVLVGSCAGFVVIVILTTTLIISLRKRTEKKQELPIG